MEPRAGFDEIWGAVGSRDARPGFEPLGAWLTGTPPAELARRQSAAEATFRSLGITFKVYGDEEDGERIIPFDIIPRIFSRAEMGEIVQGARAAGAADQRLRRRRLWSGPYPQRRHAARRGHPRQPAILCARGRRAAAARASTPTFAASTSSEPVPTTSSCWRTGQFEQNSRIPPETGGTIIS